MYKDGANDLMMTKKTEFNKRYNAMRAEAYNGWMSSWLDLSNYVDPKRGWFDTRPNRGFMIDHKMLLDAHATKSRDTMASGLLSGMTSPSRPWFRLTLDNAQLDIVPGVRSWLDEVQRRMVEVMNGSNIYSTFYSAYEELAQFGTSCFIILEDFDSVIRCRSYTAGEYFLSVDSRGRVNGFARYFWMSVGQLVKEFGLESCSPQVQNLYKTNMVDSWIKVNHLIEANETQIPGQEDFKNMPWRSMYWEFGNGTDNCLAQRGYKRFPVIATRWKTVTTDQIYGYGPGWYALGDIKELQKTAFDKLIAQEKSYNPPTQQDASVEGHANMMPGGVTKITGNVPNAGVRPAYLVNPNTQEFIQSLDRSYKKIDEFFYADLFRMIMNLNQAGKTATEINELKAEQIMMMGPVLYRIQEELLDPTMELIYSIMLDLDMIPQPPEEVQGLNIRIKYVSILAQAQQALGVEQINRVIGFAGQAAQLNPDILDNIDFDEAIREVASFEGTNAKLIKSQQDVDGIREQKAQQQQAMQLASMAPVAKDGAKAVKDLSESATGNESMLSAVGEAIKQASVKK